MPGRFTKARRPQNTPLSVATGTSGTPSPASAVTPDCQGFVSPGAHFPTAGNATVGVALWLLFFGWARLGRTATVTPR